MVRLGLAGFAVLLLSGCHSGERSALDASIEVDGAAKTVSVHCREASSGVCHVEFYAATAGRGEIRKGGSTTFAGVGPGIAACLVLDPAAFAGCQRIVLKQGTQRIAQKRVVTN